MTEEQKNQAAYDEAYRELCVRQRCFPRWIQEGKLSRTDAANRLDSQQRIVEILGGMPGIVPVTGNTTQGVDNSKRPF